MAKKEAYEEVLGRITYAQPASSQGFAKGAGFSEDWPPAAAHEGEQGRGAAGRTTPLLSWGAWLSYIVTARYPALVRKLILVGSGPFEEKYVKLIAENRLRRLSQEEKEEYLHIVDILNTSETPDSNVFLSRLGDLVHKADACDPIEIPEDTTSLDLVDNPGEIYQGVWPEAARLRRTGELLRLSVNITCPVVAIHGDCDPHPAQGIQEPLAANLKDFRMIILEKCGHDPWRERHAMDTFYAILEHELSTGRP